ncbi:hypothetical protein ADUPG1_004800, partial [Aduncisulcus paluster]
FIPSLSPTLSVISRSVSVCGSECSVSSRLSYAIKNKVYCPPLLPLIMSFGWALSGFVQRKALEYRVEDAQMEEMKRKEIRKIIRRRKKEEVCIENILFG